MSQDDFEDSPSDSKPCGHPWSVGNLSFWGRPLCRACVQDDDDADRADAAYQRRLIEQEERD